MGPIFVDEDGRLIDPLPGLPFHICPVRKKGAA
jgi:hypothetical protein